MLPFRQQLIDLRHGAQPVVFDSGSTGSCACLSFASSVRIAFVVSWEQR